MLAKDLEGYLRTLRLKADDPDTVEVVVNGMDIIKIEYAKSIDSNGVSDEVIEIISN